MLVKSIHAFGDRVSYWNTFNEANIFVMGGYDVGITLKLYKAELHLSHMDIYEIKENI